jgi:class 3 adenylate cyclase
VSERTFLFADLAGFTALPEAHGDLDAADVAERFTKLARESLDADSLLVKTIGDEAMIVAADPLSAIRTALQLSTSVNQEERFPRAAGQDAFRNERRARRRLLRRGGEHRGTGRRSCPLGPNIVYSAGRRDGPVA